LVPLGGFWPDITWIYPEINYSGEDKELADDQYRVPGPCRMIPPVPDG
jgi:hypothetical protein